VIARSRISVFEFHLHVPDSAPGEGVLFEKSGFSYLHALESGCCDLVWGRESTRYLVLGVECVSTQRGTHCPRTPSTLPFSVVASRSPPGEALNEIAGDVVWSS